PAAKKARGPGPSELPSSVISVFFNEAGERAGPPIDLPVTSSAKQLQGLINSLLSNEDKLPYAFYVNDLEVSESLEATLRELEAGGNGQSYENTLTISYQPLSVFRVRPVTRCVETMPGHTDAVLHVSFSPDGNRLASGGGDTTVRFWNIQTASPIRTCTGHKHHVLCTAWAPSGELFVSADRSGEIRAWNPANGKPVGVPMKGHKKYVTSLAFEPLHLNPACERVASASKDHTVRIWDVTTGTCEAIISGHSDAVECVKWGGTGLIYTASRDRTIMVWAVDGHGRSRQMIVRTLTGHAHRINSLALSTEYVLRTGAYQLGEPLPATPEERQAKARARYEAAVAISDGEERLVSCSDDFTMFLWRPTVDKKPIIRMTGHQQLINHIAFSPDSRYVASASFDKKVKIWCGKTGRFLGTCNGHAASVYQLSWSPDSQYLVSASKDSTVKLWKAKDTKKAMHTLPGHEDEVYALDWSPNGTAVASGSKDRTIKIWHH
ncbi:unnamed protein product, partial [Ectocarpus fasciculatus]